MKLDLELVPHFRFLFYDIDYEVQTPLMIHPYQLMDFSLLKHESFLDKNFRKGHRRGKKKSWGYFYSYFHNYSLVNWSVGVTLNLCLILF